MTTTVNPTVAATVAAGPSIMKPKAAPKATTPTTTTPTTAAAPAAPKPAPVAATPGPITPKAAVNDTRRKEFDATITRLGTQDGQGQGARVAMAFAAMNAARDQIITENDTSAVFSRYRKAAGKAGADEVLDEAKQKQQLSKLRQLIKCGAIRKFDTVPMMERALDTVKTLAGAGTIKKSRNVYEDMVQVARTQLGSPDAPLTDEQVTEAFLPKETERTFAKELKKFVDRMQKLYEGGEDVADIEGLSKAKDERFVAAMDGLADLHRDIEKQAAVSKFLADAAALGLKLA